MKIPDTKHGSHDRKMIWLASCLGAAAIAAGLYFVFITRAINPTPIVAATAWLVRVLHCDPRGVDNLQVAEDGSLYATLESLGRVIKISPTGITVVADIIRSADGLYFDGGHYLSVTEEVEDGRVMRLDLRDKSQTVVRSFDRPEGIDLPVDGELVISEDRRGVGGRIVKISLTDGSSEVLAAICKERKVWRSIRTVRFMLRRPRQAESREYGVVG